MQATIFKAKRRHFNFKIAIIIIIIMSNGNRTEWSPIRSVILRVINKIRGRPICLSDEYDYRLNWRTRSSVTN